MKFSTCLLLAGPLLADCSALVPISMREPSRLEARGTCQHDMTDIIDFTTVFTTKAQLAYSIGGEGIC